MNPVKQHFVQCAVAGMVALLPIAGLILVVVYVESQIAASWLRAQGFYFFGMGLLITAVVIYLIGLVVSTVVGRWLWRRVDLLMDRLPILGNLYQTLKQVLGYGEGPNALFQRVVYLRDRHIDGEELGLVTHEVMDEQGQVRLTVFVPHAPTPTNGRLVFVSADRTRPAAISVNQALKKLVSVGSADFNE